MAMSPGQTEGVGWEPMYESSGPKRLGDGLDKVAARLRAPRARVLGMVFDAWDELVGSVMAAHTSPVRLVDGELVVAVDDPAWAAEMRFFGAELIERINTRAEDQAVTSLTLRVRPR